MIKLRLHLILLTCVTGFLFTLSLSPLRAQERERSKRFYTINWEGETILIGSIDSINITGKMPSAWEMARGRKKIEQYTRLRWNVHKVHPYAVKVGELMKEIDAQLSQITDERAKKDYLKSKEADLFGQYEDDLRNMTRSQGKVLVKLVYRQTGKSMFEIIKNNKSGASAIFWQSIGSLFGINLKSDYDYEEDMMIEDIVKELERGGYNIVYKAYNYSL